MAAGAVVALDRIAAMVDEATTAAEEISIATQQQRSASDQVVVAMTQVSEVSRQYAAGSKQTAAASTEISALAAAMQDSISTFSVEQDTDHDLEPVRYFEREADDFAEDPSGLLTEDMLQSQSGHRAEDLADDYAEDLAEDLANARFAEFTAPGMLESDEELEQSRGLEAEPVSDDEDLNVS
ncbi:MAG TPA: hypothetical protein VMT88_12440, partial [Actinomycetes bacterium]|nr:hypothetical protein [Actinomycetes bacterium]